MDVVLANDADIAFCLRYSQLRIAFQRHCLVIVNSTSLTWQQSPMFEKATNVVVMDGAASGLLVGNTTYFLPLCYSLLIQDNLLQLKPTSSNSIFSSLRNLLASNRIKVKDLVVLKTARLNDQLARWSNEVEKIWCEIGLNEQAFIQKGVQYLSRPDLMATLCNKTLLGRNTKTNLRGGSVSAHAVEKNLLDKLFDQSSLLSKDYSQTWVVSQCLERTRNLGLGSLSAYNEYCFTRNGEMQELERCMFGAKPQPAWLLSVVKQAEELLEQGSLVQFSEESESYRVWVTSAGLGEAAYGFALAWHLSDSVRRLGKKLKIFATGVGGQNLKKASIGLHESCIGALANSGYPIHDFTQEKVEAFYSLPKLRNTIVFSRHDLKSAAPYKQIDLIISSASLCPYKEAIREGILDTFKHSLAIDGLIWLGLEDDARVGFEMKQLGFHPISQGSSVYKKTNSASRIASVYQDSQNSLPLQPAVPSVSTLLWSHKRFNRYANYQRVLDHLIDEFLLPGILFDGNYKLIHVIGDVNPYCFEPREKNFELDIRQLLKPPLSSSLSMILDEFFEQKTRRLHRIQWAMDGEQSVGDLSVHVIYENDDEKDCGVLLFDLQVSEPVETLSNLDPVKSQLHYIKRIEEDLLKSQQDAARVLQAHQENLDEMSLVNTKLAFDNEQFQRINDQLSSWYEDLTRLYQLEHHDKQCFEDVFNVFPMPAAIIQNNDKFRSVNQSFIDYLLQKKIVDIDQSMHSLDASVFRHTSLGAGYSDLRGLFEMNKPSSKLLSGTPSLYFKMLQVNELLVCILPDQ